MSGLIQAVRGMNDVLPDKSGLWQQIESALCTTATEYGYQEIRFPIVEKTELFKRSIGEVTDIVQKEMYTFCDRSNDSLTLRPEGTAACVRAALQHGLLHNQQQRLWYLGPMFRHERPQKGRYRQFQQFGVEVFGLSGVDIELELLLLNAHFWRALGIDHLVTLEINTLGTLTERNRYRGLLQDYLRANQDQLDKESIARTETNPLRVLDSKDPGVKAVLTGAPSLIDSLEDDSKSRFDNLCEALTQLEINYRVNPRLVRGLDYYSHTVFEWVTDALGAQGTVCAGGRYDGLVEQCGGRENPAVGFALGVERLALLLDTMKEKDSAESRCDIYVVVEDGVALGDSAQLIEKLRGAIPRIRVLAHCGGGSFKSQFKKADKSGAKLALVIGAKEIEGSKVTIEWLRDKSVERQMVAVDEALIKISQAFGESA